MSRASDSARLATNAQNVPAVNGDGSFDGDVCTLPSRGPYDAHRGVPHGLRDSFLSASMSKQTASPAVTIERLERAIRTVARVMVKHDMSLGPTIRFLEAERDKLQQQTADMDYAMEILRKQEAA